MATYCAVVSCKNSSKNLRKWKKEECPSHPGYTHGDCPCLIPYRLFKFPTNSEECMKWIVALNRKDFVPSKIAGVCSLHFLDGIPSESNPYPQLHLGYNDEPGRETPVYKIPPTKKEVYDQETSCDSFKTSNLQENLKCYTRKKIKTSSFSLQTQGTSEVEHGDEVPRQTADFIPLTVDVTLDLTAGSVMQAHVYKKSYDAATQYDDPALSHHSYATKKLKTSISSTSIGVQVKLPFHSILHSTKDFKSHTGLTEQLFFSLVKVLKPFSGFFKQLCLEDQILLVLMRLHLGLVYSDMAKRFSICVSSVSKLFTKWIMIMSRELGKLICWLPKETIQATMPLCFQQSYPATTCIIDCSEVFIQRPKLLKSRTKTYSSFKDHNTAKFLIAIAPSGYVMFISRMYGGKASYKYIVMDSGMLNYIKPGDEVMAGKGFTIQEELVALNANLNIPAFIRGKNQLSEEVAVITQRIANVGIHIERTICRLKSFRLLKLTFPISQKHLINDILIVCGALCNLQPSLIQENKLVKSSDLMSLIKKI